MIWILFADAVTNFAIAVERSGRTRKQLVIVRSGMSVISCIQRGTEDKARIRFQECGFNQMLKTSTSLLKFFFYAVVLVVAITGLGTPFSVILRFCGSLPTCTNQNSLELVLGTSLVFAYQISCSHRCMVQFFYYCISIF